MEPVGHYAVRLVFDDLHDTDDQLPQRLAVPTEFRRDPRDERRSSRGYRDSHTDVSDGNAATDMTARMASGVRQPDGTLMVEPRMNVDDVARGVVYMASLPLESNVQFMTVMATKMPYIARG